MNKRTLIVFFLTVFVACSMMLSYELFSLPAPAVAPDSSPPGNSLTVAIWNIHDGNTWYGTNNINNINRELENKISKQDIVFLQEVPHGEFLDNAAKSSGYHKSGKRNAILSKYPILNSDRVVINAAGRAASWADIEYTNKTIIRVYSIHLSYKANGWLYIPEIRGAEFERLIDHAGTFDGPIIIAGDFNTADIIGSNLDKRPVFQAAYRANFMNAFHEQHCNTHMILGRIDWIFYKGMSVWLSGCGIYSGSDHRWMHATFSIIN